jgi:hypothetical protein
MNVDTFSEWLRRQKHRVVQTDSGHWFDRGPRVFMAYPWHRLIQPSEEELQRLLRSENAAALRFSGPPDEMEGVVGYDVALEAGCYELKNVSGSTRPKIRRALERCEILPIPFERYAREGWRLEVDTRARQGRASRGGEAAWERMARAAADLPGFEAWGATVEGRLAASVMFAQIDDCATMLYQQSHREFWPLHVNNALTFAVTRMLTERPGVRMIHYGLQGLDSPPSVDEFKFHLGYSRRTIRQRVVVHPLVAPLMNHASHALLRGACARWKENAFLSKSEGVVRLFLEGRRAASGRTPVRGPDPPGRDLDAPHHPGPV